MLLPLRPAKFVNGLGTIARGARGSDRTREAADGPGERVPTAPWWTYPDSFRTFGPKCRAQPMPVLKHGDSAVLMTLGSALRSLPQPAISCE